MRTFLPGHDKQIIAEHDEMMRRKEIHKNIPFSPYITDTIRIDGKTVRGRSFIGSINFAEPNYEDARLIYDPFSHTYQWEYRNGERKYVSDFCVRGILIVPPTKQLHRKDILVYLHGSENPLIFPEGDVSFTAIRRQTQFNRKGLSVSSEIYCTSFIEAMRACTYIRFLMIPDYPGWNLLPNGSFDYTSSSSVIPELENLYSDIIKQHHLIQCNQKLELAVSEYKAKLPKNWKIKLAICIRIMSILLPYFETEGLQTDRIFVFTPQNEDEEKIYIALTKRYNYISLATTSLSDRINKVREMLSMGNDITVIFTYRGANASHSFMNALNEIRLNVSRENGDETVTRKIIILVTDIPGFIPEDYPAFFLSFDEEIADVDAKELQKVSGELDYSLIQFLKNNPDSAIDLINESIDNAKELASNFVNYKRNDTLTMLIATAVLLKKKDLISGIELQSILNWLGKEATSRMSVDDTVCNQVKDAVSNAVVSGELGITKQFGPPYYSDDGYTAFIARLLK